MTQAAIRSPTTTSASHISRNVAAIYLPLNFELIVSLLGGFHFGQCTIIGGHCFKSSFGKSAFVGGKLCTKTVSSISSENKKGLSDL